MEYLDTGKYAFEHVFEMQVRAKVKVNRYRAKSFIPFVCPAPYKIYR